MTAPTTTIRNSAFVGIRKGLLWLGMTMLAVQGSGVRLHAADAVPDTFFIQEYLVDGVTLLPQLAVGKAVYPFLGPDRTSKDVEGARAALEALYRTQGYETVTVEIPEQQKSAKVRLVVNEVPVGRLRVRNAKYSPPSTLTTLAPSLAEGKVVNFHDVPQDIAALNELPDRQITPTIHPGVAPGTVDVDLDVKEKSPIHGSVELNNRRSANTEPLRLTAAVSDNNLAQTGDAVGLSFQDSPQKPSQVAVLTAYYLARIRALNGIGLMFQGMDQNSNVSTIGSTAVAGRGQSFGVRANLPLPSEAGFFQSASAGIDYKHFNQTVNLPASGTTAASVLSTPITYYPLSANYSATWQGKNNSTDLNLGTTFHIRGTGGNSAQFGNDRYGADANFLVLRSDISHTHDLPWGFQAFGKLQGQLADQPLINNEQLAGGGLGTARGYLEAEALGDNGLFGTVEFRSPSLLGLIWHSKGEWRIYGFADAGRLTVNQPLADQASRYDFASFGVGTRVQLTDHFDGSFNAAFPRTEVGSTTDHSVSFTFRAALNY